MATITTANRTEPTTSTVSTTPTETDSRREAAIKAFQENTKVANAIKPPITASTTPPPGTPQTPLATSSPEATSAKLEASVDNTTEPVVDTKPATKQEPSDELKTLAAREKQAWAELKKVKQEKTDLQKAQEGWMSKDEFIQQLRRDPSSLGLSVEELGQLYLTQGQPIDPALARLQAEIAELKGQITQAKTQAEDQSTQAYKQALKQIDSDTRNLVSTDDRFEIVRARGAEHSVVKLIELTFHEDGVLLDIESAATQIEAELEAEADRLFKTKKLMAKLRPAAPIEPTHSSPPAQTRTSSSSARTLTPEMSQASTKPLDRKQRAILAFQGKLKD